MLSPPAGRTKAVALADSRQNKMMPYSRKAPDRIVLSCFRFDRDRKVLLEGPQAPLLLVSSLVLVLCMLEGSVVLVVVVGMMMVIVLPDLLYCFLYWLLVVVVVVVDWNRPRRRNFFMIQKRNCSC